MGLLYGLEKTTVCLKRKFRFTFEIPGVACDDTPGVNALPPETGARPNLGFKEMEAKHLMEDMFYPCKPDWRPVTLTLYDLVRPKNPVFEWITKAYDVKAGRWLPAVRTNVRVQDRFIKDCYVKLFDGCGNLYETWVYEDAWPNSVNFQTLDMKSNDHLVCEVSLRYA